MSFVAKPKLSEEIDRLVQARNEKRLAQMNKEGDHVGFVVGSYLDVKGTLEPNVRVRCSRCQFPLYCTPHSYRISQENNFPLVCYQCAREINDPLVRGTILQDRVAIAELERKMQGRKKR